MTLRTLNYGNYGIFLIMDHAGFCPSTVLRLLCSLINLGASQVLSDAGAELTAVNMLGYSPFLVASASGYIPAMKTSGFPRILF